MRAARYLLIGVLAALAGYAALGIQRSEVESSAAAPGKMEDRRYFFRRTSTVAADVKSTTGPSGVSIGCSAPGSPFFDDRPAGTSRQAPPARCMPQVTAPQPRAR